jgi:hypothetical protein
MKKEVLVLMVTASLLAAGCMSSRHAHREEQRAPAERLSMTKDDIIALTKEGVGDEVIIEQIKATRSIFELSKDDIIELKQAGASERVIRAMIKTLETDRPPRLVRGYYRSPSFDGYPWYPAFRWGFSSRYSRPYFLYIAPRVYAPYRHPLYERNRSSGRPRR